MRVPVNITLLVLVSFILLMNKSIFVGGKSLRLLGVREGESWFPIQKGHFWLLKNKSKYRLLPRHCHIKHHHCLTDIINTYHGPPKRTFPNSYFVKEGLSEVRSLAGLSCEKTLLAIAQNTQ